MNEIEFLQQIRARRPSGANAPFPNKPHPGRLGRPARTLPDDLLAEFTERLTAVGGQVHIVTDAAAARVAVRDILGGRAIRRAVLSGHEILAEMEMDQLLARLGVEVVEVEGAGETAVAAMAQADVGLTGVEYAIAASGTLVMAASPYHPRAVSLLPPLHIAVVRQNQLLPDLAALARRLEGGMPSGLALITGPSRTADIEQTLSIGVHGPGEVHVLMQLDN